MKQITVQELDTMLRKLEVSIKEIVNVTAYDKYEDWSCIADFERITDPDQLQLLDEYQTVLRHLCDIHYMLLYQQREVIGEGILSLNARDYFEDEYHEYHCGDTIEYYFFDDWDEKYKWRTSRIEHNGRGYYIVGNPEIGLDGLRVRHRKS